MLDGQQRPRGQARRERRQRVGLGAEGRDPLERRELRAALRALAQVGLEALAIARVERAQHVAGDVDPEVVVAAHAIPPSSSPSLSARSAWYVRVFTVPSGISSRAAISVWLRPSS